MRSSASKSSKISSMTVFSPTGRNIFGRVSVIGQSLVA